jgi:hypothetical protein
MAQVFSPGGVLLVKLVLLAAIGIVAAGSIVYYQHLQGPNALAEAPEQPIPFSHKHHAGGDGIDCRYCHQSVERAPSAGIPATALCMNCHAQIWNKSPRLEPVRASYFTGQPIAWVRVHRLPDFVYFNHAIHVNKGVGCETCHGRVDQMAAIYQFAPLTMGWCVDCHRNPAPNLRPLDQITTMGWRPEGDPAALAQELMKRHDIHSRTSCSTCHR